MIDYTIGDDIVCVKSHSQGTTKEGQVFVAKALSMCSCGAAIVDVGKKFQIPNAIHFSKCTYCGTRIRTEILWLDANLFRKLDTLIDISELTEILKEPSFK